MYKKTLFILTFLICSTSFAIPQRTARNIIPAQNQQTALGPVRDFPNRDRIEVISYDDEESLDFFLTMPDEAEFGDHSFNVRFTPEEGPFRVIGLEVMLFDLGGEPGMEVSVTSSDEDGFPGEEIISFEVDNEDLTFSDEDNFEWNEIDFEDYEVVAEFEEAEDFHIVLNVIQGDERDTLALIMDNGENQPTDRSGFWNGEWDVWDLNEIVFEIGYNFALRAVVEYPDEVIRWGEVDQERREIEGGHELQITIPVLGLEENMQWFSEFEIISEPEENQERWVFYEPQEGEIEPGQDIETTMTFMGDSLVGGDYEVDLTFRLEDEAVDPLVISVLWHLEGISRIEFDLDTLDFGVLEGEPEPQEMTLTIYNTGTDFLSIESIQVNGEVFHCSGEFPIDIEVFDSTEVEVQFSPEEYGTYEGSLVFTTNDPRGDVEIPMRGVYYAPPSITVNPAGIESINGGEYDLTIGNSGGAILNWSVNDIPEWISIDPDSGLVEINGEVEIAVMIDTTGLEPGNHQSSISIHSNDPENEEVIIDVSLAVFPSSVHNEIEFPTEFSLISIYPNPFNSTTTITYGLPVSGYVSLELFNQSGQRKKTLTTGYEKAGTHQANLNSDALPSGLYFLKYQAGNKITTGKVILVK